MEKISTVINGEEKEATVLLNFESDEFNKEFIVYTYDDVESLSDSDKCDIYASEVTENDLVDISDEEWAYVKETLRTALSDTKEGE